MKEVAAKIKKNLNLTKKKTPGFDLISGEIFQQSSRKGILIYRFKHVPVYWKTAKVFIILDRSGALEEKHVCSVVFLDVAQAFDKILHIRLMHKLNKMIRQIE